ncbi:MAG: histidine--tRNA ligase [Candidatus Obscuribacterales bacterium]|nr:histidine--tRNA ligase [Steroidobacteraceae bacterium]
MSEPSLQPITGMHDVLPSEIALWQRLERAARELFAAYGYQELRVPIVERTDLFKRSIGELTDVVSKEMYSFEDRGGEQITLRPEATAGMVRAMITNGLIHNQRQRVWCMGPMFRYERPQKGRFRQFHQIDVEAFGYAGPDVDAEMIMMSARLFQMLDVKRLVLNINSLGTAESRRAYRELLVKYFSDYKARLDGDSLRRLEGNPLRILDSKNPDLADIIANAPLLTEHLDAESQAHFAILRAHLDAVGIEYIVNPRLVRGLDYYSRTVFEWVTTELGAQDAVCSGGRYDGLVAQLGGESTPAIGWALGEERLVALMQAQGMVAATVSSEANPQVVLVLVGDAAQAAGLTLAERLRDQMPQLRLETLCGGGSFKSQLKRADKSGARYAIILGEAETEQRVAGLKSLRIEAPQVDIGWDVLADELRSRLAP